MLGEGIVSFAVWPGATLSRRNRRGRVLEVLVLAVERHLDRVVPDLRDAAELVDEVHVPRLAAQLPVGGGLQADLALHPDVRQDGGVLDLLELPRRNLACGELRTGLEHLFRAQEAADVVGSEGRTDVVGHTASSLLLVTAGYCWSGCRGDVRSVPLPIIS